MVYYIIYTHIRLNLNITIYYILYHKQYYILIYVCYNNTLYVFIIYNYIILYICTHLLLQTLTLYDKTLSKYLTLQVSNFLKTLDCC